jgi:hypothetical protein
MENLDGGGPRKFAWAVIGAIAIVRFLMLAAGSSFTTWRQILTAYLAFGVASVFIAACGYADGGVPNYSQSLVHIAGTVIALALELFTYVIAEPSTSGPPRDYTRLYSALKAFSIMSLAGLGSCSLAAGREHNPYQNSSAEIGMGVFLLVGALFLYKKWYSR